MTHHFKVISRNLPANFLRKTLHRPWMRLFVFLDEGPLSRTPEHYKKFIYDWKVVTPSPIYYIPETEAFKKDEDGLTQPVQNIPIPLMYPDEMHEGLWGGEAVIKGFQTIEKKRRSYPMGHYWVPELTETVVYSEILNKYMKTIVTERALTLIDKHYGLDPYILQTPPCDLYTEMALKLRREMLYALHHKSLYPDDPVKRDEIYNKYKQYLIPEEEIEWYGLNLGEAYRKQMKLEEADKVGPYKHIFRKEFIEHLKNAQLQEKQETEEESKKTLMEKLSRFSPFKNKSL